MSGGICPCIMARMISLPCSASESLTGRLIGTDWGFIGGHTTLSSISLIACISPCFASSISFARISGKSSAKSFLTFAAVRCAGVRPLGLQLVPFSTSSWSVFSLLNQALGFGFIFNKKALCSVLYANTVNACPLGV